MSDWFGSIGKDLSGFVGEVTKSVQEQVTQLQEANGNNFAILLRQPLPSLSCYHIHIIYIDAEKQQATQGGYAAFANASALDSLFTWDANAPPTEQQSNDNLQTPETRKGAASSSATPSSLSSMIKGDESDLDISDDDEEPTEDQPQDKDKNTDTEQKEEVTSSSNQPTLNVDDTSKDNTATPQPQDILSADDTDKDNPTQPSIEQDEITPIPPKSPTLTNAEHQNDDEDNSQIKTVNDVDGDLDKSKYDEIIKDKDRKYELLLAQKNEGMEIANFMDIFCIIYAIYPCTK